LRNSVPAVLPPRGSSRRGGAAAHKGGGEHLLAGEQFGGTLAIDQQQRVAAGTAGNAVAFAGEPTGGELVHRLSHRGRDDGTVIFLLRLGVGVLVSHDQILLKIAVRIGAAVDVKV